MKRIKNEPIENAFHEIPFLSLLAELPTWTFGTTAERLRAQHTILFACRQSTAKTHRARSAKTAGWCLSKHTHAIDPQPQHWPVDLLSPTGIPPALSTLARQATQSHQSTDSKAKGATRETRTRRKR